MTTVKDAVYYLDGVVVGTKGKKQQKEHKVVTGKMTAKKAPGLVVKTKTGNLKYLDLVDSKYDATHMSSYRYNAFGVHRSHLVDMWNEAYPKVCAPSEFDKFCDTMIKADAPKPIYKLYAGELKPSTQPKTSSFKVTELNTDTMGFEIKLVKTSVALKTVNPSKPQCDNGYATWLKNKPAYNLFNNGTLPNGGHVTSVNGTSEWFSKHGTPEWHEYLKRSRKSTHPLTGIYVATGVMNYVQNAGSELFGALLLECLITQCGDKYFTASDIVDYLTQFGSTPMNIGNPTNPNTYVQTTLREIAGYFIMKSYNHSEIPGVKSIQLVENQPKPRTTTKRSNSPKVANYTNLVDPEELTSVNMSKFKSHGRSRSRSPLKGSR